MSNSRPTRLAGMLCAALACASPLTACGSSGGGSKTFSDQAMSISFTYPSGLNGGTITTIAQHAGAHGPAARKAVAVDRHNVLLVEKYKVTIPTTKANLPELERASDQVISALFRRSLNGTRTTLNGLPAVTYPPLPSAGHTTSQISYVFLDGAGYELDCQWTSKHASEMKQACRQMKSTLKRRP
jgi:hypothetical protein